MDDIVQCLAELITTCISLDDIYRWWHGAEGPEPNDDPAGSGA